MNSLEIKNQISEVLEIVDKKNKIINEKIDLFIEDFSNFKNYEIKRDNMIEERLKNIIDKKFKELETKIDNNLNLINNLSNNLITDVNEEYKKLKSEALSGIISKLNEHEIFKQKLDEIEKLKKEIREIKFIVE